jgi:peptidoglycan/LPS O-acetylase OafA/YrhL
MNTSKINQLSLVGSLWGRIGAWINSIQAPGVGDKARVGRYPNFDILRLLLAVEVAFVHAWSIIDPAFSWNAYVMAVPGFLAISGFLVLQSYSESGSWLGFLRKRALRILPALVVSLILCLVLFGWAGMYNSLLNYITGGLYTLNGMANGPLWSLSWEEVAYLVLALLWTLGAYRKPFWIWLLLIISVAIVWAGENLDPHVRIILFLGPAFFVGNLMFLYRTRLLGVASFFPWVLFFIMLKWRLLPDAALLGGASLLLFQSFAVVWVGIAGTKIIPFKFPDISYGIYVYHLPIILYLSSRYGVSSLARLGFLTAVLLIPFSLFSWYLVEKPVLRWKNRKPPAVVDCVITS